jgi:hypothetical protein
MMNMISKFDKDDELWGVLMESIAFGDDWGCCGSVVDDRVLLRHACCICVAERELLFRRGEF